jgi:hypothetical protein
VKKYIDRKFTVSSLANRSYSGIIFVYDDVRKECDKE